MVLARSCIRRKDAAVQDKHAGSGGVSPLVNDVLRSPGRPLDGSMRSLMESRFRYDFGRVRIHTDTRAAESAQAVDALAYTVGRHVVFGAGQYAPQTSEGHRLLAHELTHVAQQGTARSDRSPERSSHPDSALERSADASAEAFVHGSSPTVPAEISSQGTLFRRVGKVNCPPNVFGAPADPKAALETVNPIAVTFATEAADALAADAEDTKGGIPAAPSVTFASYRDHFGLPVPAGKGFLNRLTGAVRPSQAVAASEELRILSRRFRFSSRLLNDTVNFRCPGNATVTLPGCGSGSCGAAFAFSCRGGSTIALCQPFWDELGSDETKAAALIHESTHIILGPGGGGAAEQGAIGETTQTGSGRNFNIAGCYEFIIDDLNGIDSVPVCPPVPET